MRIRYGRWTGTQDPFGPDVGADEVLDALSDDLLDGMDPSRALQRLLRSGMSGRVAGLGELRDRVEQARRRELSRMGLEGPLQQVADALDEIVGMEQAALELADLADPAADAVHPADSATMDGADEEHGAGVPGAETGPDDTARRQQFLDGLPSEPASRIRALEDYDFTDERAGRAFAELVERLRQEVADATFGRLAQALGGTRPEDLARTRDLLADVNAMVAKRDRGEDIAADWDRFRATYADVLAGLGDPGTLDDLLAELARRMAAMSALMAGMSADQRRQLAELAGELFDDPGLQFETDRLQQTLQQQFPEMGWGQAPEGAMPTGEESGSLSQTVDWVERLQQMEDLGEALGQQYPGARLEDIDSGELRAVLGDEAAQDLAALREIERVLEEAGAVVRREGRLELTARGVRRLGERSLLRIYDRALEGEVGGHRTPAPGGAGELTGSTRAYAFGDPFRLDVSRTIGNAVRRGGRRHGSGGVRLDAGDFELAEAEHRVRAVTVLMLDMSFSMPLRGNWDPAKRMALALQSLVASRFPEDEFHIIGFSDYARRLQPRDLLVSGWERVYGTNMQHAFLLARRILDAHPGSQQQLIMVTDGEPTAHLEGEQALFAWPPEPETLALTMREAKRVTRGGATLNVFLLDHDPGAAAFVERMVSTCGGRIFYPDLADLGRVVVRDFLHRRAG